MAERPVESLFKGGFARYLDSEEFTDIELISGDRRLKAHRIVLVHTSQYFASLLTSDFKEKNEKEIRLQFADPEGLFPVVLRFMYTGCITITRENAIPLLALADHYLITALGEKISEFICSDINNSNALLLLENSLRYNVTEIVDKVIDVVAKNFYRFQDSVDWTWLPPKVFLQLLEQEYLTIKSEHLLYELICRYVEKNPIVEPGLVSAMMETVRFRWLSLAQLKAVESNPLVPKHLVIEALMARLEEKEDPSWEPDPNQKRFQPRVAFGMQFEYLDDFDKNGILYWIATDGLCRAWSNPHLSQAVVVTASSVDKGELEQLVSRQPGELWTQDVPAQWFCIDLGHNSTLRPTHYTLRHGANYKSDSLRCWDFQGSANGRDWTVIRRHTKDASLAGPFATHTWEVESEKSYRYFRVLQTGHNSSNHNFLLVSGIELYGDLYEFKHVD
mmetsp:Transcript_1210/g.4347  ORF Transcript_1210/g.4347 Transcript_1210/m.4347 type:complete len:447 (+) Transcript_1210:70-1410(+)